MQIQCFHSRAFSLLFLLLSGIQAVAQSEGFHWTTTVESASLTENGKPVLSYQIAMRDKDGKWPRANYVHPLYGMSGEVVTEDFPEDHGHHRGIFWAWHQVLVDGKSLGDAWLCKDFVWDVQDVDTSSSLENAAIKSTVVWKSPDLLSEKGDLIPVAREQVWIRVNARRDNYQTIDFQIEVHALVSSLQIGGSEDVKGYGGFSPRIKLNPKQKFVGVAGTVEPQTTAINAGPWINVKDALSGFAVLGHSSNPVGKLAAKNVEAEFQPWILRRSGSMQNAVYPGRKPVSIKKDNPLRLQYRVVIHDGSISAHQLEELHKEFQP